MGWEVLRDEKGVKILCRCSCGKEQYVNRYNLRDGKTSGCVDCSKAKRRDGKPKCRCGASVTSHRHSRCKKCSDENKRTIQSAVPTAHYVRLANKVKNAIRRCTDEGHRHWAYYGGRGIKVYEAWVANPSLFLSYIAALPGANDPELELDRTENDGNYEPGNLRFVTHNVSMRNRRKRTRRSDGTFATSVLS